MGENGLRVILKHEIQLPTPGASHHPSTSGLQGHLKTSLSLLQPFSRTGMGHSLPPPGLQTLYPTPWPWPGTAHPAPQGKSQSRASYLMLVTAAQSPQEGGRAETQGQHPPARSGLGKEQGAPTPHHSPALPCRGLNPGDGRAQGGVMAMAEAPGSITPSAHNCPAPRTSLGSPGTCTRREQHKTLSPHLRTCQWVSPKPAQSVVNSCPFLHLPAHKHIQLLCK